MKFFGGQRFNDDEVKTADMDWTSSQMADFFEVEFKKFVDESMQNLEKNIF